MLTTFGWYGLSYDCIEAQYLHTKPTVHALYLPTWVEPKQRAQGTFDQQLRKKRAKRARFSQDTFMFDFVYILSAVTQRWLSNTHKAVH